MTYTEGQIAFFRYVEQFIQLSDELKSALAEVLIERSYLKNQYILQQHSVCSAATFVVKGCLRTFVVNAQGVEHTVTFAVENWWTADIESFITQQPAVYNVVCLEPSNVVQLPHHELEQLYNSFPELERLFRLMYQRAYAVMQRKLTDQILLDASARYDLFLQQHPEIEQRVPQYMIASYLGITKEFLSKLRATRSKN